MYLHRNKKKKKEKKMITWLLQIIMMHCFNCFIWIPEKQFVWRLIECQNTSMYWTVCNFVNWFVNKFHYLNIDTRAYQTSIHYPKSNEMLKTVFFFKQIHIVHNSMHSKKKYWLVSIQLFFTARKLFFKLEIFLFCGNKF